VNVEFARLAAARKVVAVTSSAGSITEDRANAERWILRFGAAAAPDDGTTTDAQEHSVVVRPAGEAAGSPWILYIHGGGMIYYSTAVFLPFLRVLAGALQSTVEAFDYLKAPEHTVEQSLEQLGAHIAARCETSRGRPLVIAGDSVGGLLALYVSLRILPRVFSRIVLIYPVLDLRTERESYRIFGEGCFLDRNAMRRFKSILEPYFSERGFDPFDLSQDDVARLPACSLVTSGCDVLRDEGLAWAEYLVDRAVRPRHQHFPELPHDFCLYAGKLESARRAVAGIAATAFHLEEERCP
jgi:acetyl esterase